MTDEKQDDLIEATIRRVAEAKARSAAHAPGNAPIPEPADVPDAPSPAQSGPAPARAAPADIDDDVIEATIRRVAAAKAAQAAPDADVDPPAIADDSAHEDDGFDRGGDDTPEPEPEPVGAAPLAIGNHVLEPVRAQGMGASDAQPWQAALARLEQEVADLRGEVITLTARVNRELLRTTAGNTKAAVPAGSGDDEDWDDAPVLQAMPAGAPRPAIFRDNVARAVKEPQPFVDSGDVEIDTRPLPEPPPPIRVEQKRGLDLLPRTYRITVEDKRRGVDLVPLHRALLGMDNVRDMSLLSFANGVAIVSVETVDELDPRALEESVSRAMSRPARAEVHNESTFVVKLAEE